MKLLVNFDSLFLGIPWKFVPSKYTRPPKEFRIYGNVVRQTVLDNFVVRLDKCKSNDQ